MPRKMRGQIPPPAALASWVMQNGVVFADRRREAPRAAPSDAADATAGPAQFRQAVNTKCLIGRRRINFVDLAPLNASCRGLRPIGDVRLRLCSLLKKYSNGTCSLVELNMLAPLNLFYATGTWPSADLRHVDVFCRLILLFQFKYPNQCLPMTGKCNIYFIEDLMHIKVNSVVYQVGHSCSLKVNYFVCPHHRKEVHFWKISTGFWISVNKWG